MQVINLKTSQKAKKKVSKNLTREEKLIWDYIKERKLYNLKFKKNINMGKYHFNFYCSEIEYGIEINDKSHTKKYITTREEYLNFNGITSTTVNSSEVLSDVEDILEKIKTKVELLKV